MIKLRHEKMLILRCILPQKTELSQEKKLPPPDIHHLTRNTSHWEYLNPMRNLKLLEKYHRHKRKENLQENEQTSLLVKVSTTLKLPQPL